MKRLTHNLALSFVALAVISGCASNSNQSQTDNVAIKQTPSYTPIAQALPPKAEQPLTLNQIMADPDWMGIFAKGAYWADDSQAIYFARQASAAPLASYYRQGVNETNAQKLSLEQLHSADQKLGVFNSDKSQKAYLYQGNLFVKYLASGEIKQFTRQNTPIDGVRFLNDGTLAYWQGESLFRIHQTSGLVEQLANIKMANEPKGVTEPESYIAKQQHRLINYVALQQSNATAKAAYQTELAELDPTMASKTWYLGDSEVVSELSLSPDGQYVVLALTDKNYSWRSEHDIMPNYLGKDGYVDAVPARARVAEDNPPGMRLVLLDLKNHEKLDITIEG